MSSWADEMNQMLAVFERQAKVSLGNIETAFERSGLSLNDKFKQYFLRTSYNRLEETYDQFELTSMLNKRCNYDTTGSTSTPDEWPITNTTQTRNYDTIEPIDSSDDKGDQPGYRMKLELLEELAAIQNNDDHDMTSELNDVEKYYDDDNDGNYDDEVINSHITNFQKEFPLFTGNGHSGMNATSKTTITNKVIRIGIEKMAQKSIESPRERDKSGSNSKSPATKRSTSSNQLDIKKRFQCKVCQYSCIHMCNLKRHIRIHTGEKPHRCDICHKRFSESRDMKRHKVTHTNEIPFYCRGCFTEFSQKDERKDHEKVCKRRRYECHICKKYATYVKNMLKMHMTKHSGEKPFQCEICMKRFTAKCNLKKHLDTIHTRVDF